MADSGSGDDEKTPPPRGGGGEFTKEPTGEEIDQSNLGPESQEHISLDQFGQFSQNELLAGMSQHLQPDMNQLLSQQQATLQVLAQQQALAQMAQQQQSGGAGQQTTQQQQQQLNQQANVAQQLLAAQLAQLQAAQLAQLQGWGAPNQDLSALYNPLGQLGGLNMLGLGGNDMYQNPLLNPMLNGMGGNMQQAQAQQPNQMGRSKHAQNSPRGKKPGHHGHGKKKQHHQGGGGQGAFGMGSIENQLMDIIKMQGGQGPNQPGGGGGGDHQGQAVISAVGGAEGGVSDEDRYSRKVFVGGLPPDIDEDEITASFRQYGPLCVDWPHKNESKSYFPPKGYAFLLFQDEISVHQLVEVCVKEDDKLFTTISSPTIKDKSVQIRPWNISDSDFVMDGSAPLDPRKTIFVGGVPRPLRAVELAIIMDRLYGSVCYAGIDTDPELKYPKGAGRVAFSSQQSYIAAISARFVQLQHGEIDKRVEVKPYVLDDQMCDECSGTRCAGKFAPFFCANVTCLQYYCETCWSTIHSRPGREFHKPLVKESTYTRNSQRVQNQNQNPLNQMMHQ